MYNIAKSLKLGGNNKLMIFNSYIFVLLFLPTTILGYYLLINFRQYSLATLFLFIASLIFYGYMNPHYVFFILFNILVNYNLYKGIQLYYNKDSIKGVKIILALGIVFNIGMLLYFKYCNFFIENINLLLGSEFTLQNIILPLGISFITFQQIAFLIDTYRKETPNCNILEYSLFVSYFPHVVSGPILLHKDFFPQLNEEKRKMDWEFFASGLYMFVMGLGKKVLIADMFGKVVNWGYLNVFEMNATSALFISIAYSVQIYFDFSGYSDMAIGISRMLQIDLPINFNSPYKARTILEFWDRWHITLTRFLTKYLYIPLGGSRKGTTRTYINIIIIFLCSGLWHGAYWTFIAWGFLHGCFMVFTRCFKKQFEKIPTIINRILTLLFVNFAWILFRSESFNTFKQMIKAILRNRWGGLNETICNYFKPVLFESLINIDTPYWLWVIITLIVVFFMIFACENVQEKVISLKYSVVSGIWIIAIALLSILSFSDISTFIYSRF